MKQRSIVGHEVILASSMAKAFGVPVAVLAGSEEIVERFEAESETRMHCSPPAVATLHAAVRALELNQWVGNAIRLHLACLVSHFRQRLKDVALAARGGYFPVQIIDGIPSGELQRVYRQFLHSGIRSVLTRSRHDSTLQLSLLITARHTPSQINHTVHTLGMIAGSAAELDGGYTSCVH